jgi:hypothetical protein
MAARQVALRRRATVAFGAGELQGRLNDMRLEAIAEDEEEEEEEVMVTKEEKKENGIEEANDLEESPSPAALWLVETLLSTSNKVTPKRKWLFIPVLRRQNTIA